MGTGASPFFCCHCILRSKARPHAVRLRVVPFAHGRANSSIAKLQLGKGGTTRREAALCEKLLAVLPHPHSGQNFGEHSLPGQSRVFLSSINSPRSLNYRWILICVIIIAFGFYVWTIQRDLPFTPEIDEPIFVLPAIRMASSGNLNPGWFGNPGSTVIYPLALRYHL